MTLSGLNQSVHSRVRPDLPIPGVSLRSCNELQEVHILLLSFTTLPRTLENLISSITSRKLRRISLTFIDYVDGENSDEEYEPDFEGEDEYMNGGETVLWDSFDATLGNLALRAHNTDTKLALQLNVRQIKPGPLMVDHLLPKFLGYGGLVDINFKGELTPLSTRSLSFNSTASQENLKNIETEARKLLVV